MNIPKGFQPLTLAAGAHEQFILYHDFHPLYTGNGKIGLFFEAEFLSSTLFPSVG